MGHFYGIRGLAGGVEKGVAEKNVAPCCCSRIFCLRRPGPNVDLSIASMPEHTVSHRPLIARG